MLGFCEAQTCPSLTQAVLTAVHLYYNCAVVFRKHWCREIVHLALNNPPAPSVKIPETWDDIDIPLRLGTLQSVILCTLTGSGSLC